MVKFLAPLVLFVLFVPLVLATSSQAYKDYLYQFDVYRTKYADFQVAKNEYLKFKTLTSQTTALDKTKQMMAQRDQLLRAYLLLLNEKLNENAGMADTERNTYQTYIRNEVAFLEGHSKLVESIGTLEDAQETSRDLESHYAVLQASIRQTISGISLGDLSRLAKSFDITLADAKALVTTNRGIFTPEKQATLDRWVLQITNVRSLYQQKVDTMRSLAEQLRGTSIEEQNQRFATIKRGVGEARQYLLDGSGFLGELTTALKYQD
ncbi:hypothetical protein HY086_02500 [Candidatus Gottesmanbacteria bacterium]|nr:hypothetical protein [Candidatus Gottesmanbacteria bacterium]